MAHGSIQSDNYANAPMASPNADNIMWRGAASGLPTQQGGPPEYFGETAVLGWGVRVIPGRGA
ncbi:hypothetical protein CGQ24_05940 [Arthrobacter sp. 7749]|nr:hypothetical protein CGQ24_05940 [Arthrobacter sp. 7749]